MKPRKIALMVAAAVGMAFVAPVDAVAKPKYTRKHVKRHYERNDRWHHSYHNNYWRPYKYDRPKYENESWGFNINPGGGLSIYYSERDHRPGYWY